MKKKILSLTIGPVLVLGLITIVLMLTMVKDSMIDEVQEALKARQQRLWQHMTKIRVTT